MSNIIEQDIVMSEDGGVSKTTVPEPRANKVDLICDKITDPNYDPAEVSLMIAAEIAHVAREMTHQGSDPSEAWRLKGHSEQIKAFLALGKQLNDADVLSKKDVLNFDGPKFAFALDAIVTLFTKALKEAGVEESQRTSIMKHYKDLMQTHEKQIRQDTAKIDSNSKSK